MAKPVKKPHTWTVADAKARLSELLRLANDQPQYIGSNRSHVVIKTCLLYTSPSPRDATLSRMPSSA